MLKLQFSPILIKEMRSTMRGKRTFLGVTLFLTFLTGLTLLVYYSVVQQSSYSVRASSEAGRTIFAFVSVIELFMLATVAPPLTAGAIAGERQRQTFDMLMATPLTPRQVLRGKLLASMNYLFLLIFAGLPINSIVFLFGGISPSALLWWLAVTLISLLMLGTLGLFMSTLFRNSGSATALSYLLCVVLFLILPLGTFFVAGVIDEWDKTSRCVAAMLWVTHPGGAIGSIIINEDQYNPLMLLPAWLPLYSAVAGLFFLAAEARLSKLTSQRWFHPFLIASLLLVIIVSLIYIMLVPATEFCNW